MCVCVRLVLVTTTFDFDTDWVKMKDNLFCEKVLSSANTKEKRKPNKHFFFRDENAFSSRKNDEILIGADFRDYKGRLCFFFKGQILEAPVRARKDVGLFP
jgi:hypothetical protein